MDRTEAVSRTGVSTVQSPFVRMATLTSSFSESAYETAGQPSDRRAKSFAPPRSFEESSTVVPENAVW